MFGFLRQRVLCNPVFAKNSNDQWAFGAFLFGGHLAVWYEIFHVLPFYHPPGSSMALMHTCVALLLYIHWLVSLYYFTGTKAVGDFAELRSKQQDSWRYCTACIEYQPPRSHHCRACGACILKRDHHCWFGGCCVGHANQRYYVCMLTNLWLAALYANLFHLDFLGHVMGGLGLGTWLCVLIPHVAGITGFLTLQQFFVAVISFVALLCLFMFSWLLGIQIVQLRHGQTKYEKKKGYVVYDLGFVGNARDVLGSRWYVAWLLPWIPSPLPGDGITFVKSVKAK